MTSMISTSHENATTDELDAVRRDLRDRCLLRHLPLAYSLARRHAGLYGTEQELVAVAKIGLVRATEEFDPAGGAPFAPYAEQQIVYELEDFIRVRDADRADPRTPGSEAAAAGRAVADAVGRQPHVRELAEFLGCPIDAIVDGLMAALDHAPHLINSLAAGEQQAPEPSRRIT